MRSNTIDCSTNFFSPANVPEKYSFELKDLNQISSLTEDVVCPWQGQTTSSLQHRCPARKKQDVGCWDNITVIFCMPFYGCDRDEERQSASSLCLLTRYESENERGPVANSQDSGNIWRPKIWPFIYKVELVHQLLESFAGRALKIEGPVRLSFWNCLVWGDSFRTTYLPVHVPTYGVPDVCRIAIT